MSFAPRGRRPLRSCSSRSDTSAHGPEGEIAKLRLPYRILLNEQKFVVVHAHIPQLQLEATRIQELHPANTNCPECKGKGEVPQHGGLRQKTCPRCGGRAGSMRRRAANRRQFRPAQEDGVHARADRITVKL
jgi:hypothetical protein